MPKNKPVPLDRRTAVGRALGQFRQELCADLGGEENLSRRDLALIDIATNTWLLLQTLDAWLIELGQLIDPEERRLIPAARERIVLVRTLLEIFDRLPDVPATRASALAAVLGEYRVRDATSGS